MDPVCEYRVPDLFTLSISGSVAGRLSQYLKRIGREANDGEAKVSYGFSDAVGELRLWDEDSRGLSEPQLVETKEVQALPIFFETRYFFRADFEECVKNVRVVHPLSAVADCFNFSRNTLVGTLDFINTPGKFRLNLEIQKESTIQTTTLEFMVVSVKMDVVHDYRTILEAIEREQKNLVYAFLSKTLGNAGYSADKEESQDAVWYAIFQKVFTFYKDACERVIHQPYLKYVSYVHYEKADKVKRWSPRLANRFLSIGKGRQEHEYFRTEEVTSDVDSVENRFVLFTLIELQQHLINFAGKLDSLESISKDYVSRIEEQSKTLERMSKHPFFKRVGRFRGFRQESLVLQKRQGYAQIYASWLTLKNALDPTGTDVDIGYRSISALYEFWAFLAIRDDLADRFGEPSETIGDISKLADLLDDESAEKETATLCKMDVVFQDSETKRKVTLSYQKTYGTNSSEANFAYLNSQRPDIVLTIQESENGLPVFSYLFDAKYRISEIGDKDASPREAIDDMHRYRDAILYRAQTQNAIAHEIIGAYVLFPGRPLPESFDYSNSIRSENIGAIPLLPTEKGKTSLHKFLDEVFAKCGIKAHLAAVIPPRGAIIQIDSADAIKEVTVYGTTHGKEQVEWIGKNGFYALPREEAELQEVSTVDKACLKRWLILAPPQRSNDRSTKVLKILECCGIKSDSELLNDFAYFHQPTHKSYFVWKVDCPTFTVTDS